MHDWHQPIGYGLSLALVAALVACKPQPPQPQLQTPAPMDTQTSVQSLPTDTSAVQGLDRDRATIAQAVQAEQQLPPPVASRPASGGGVVPAKSSELNQLRSYLGQYPSDGMNFLEQGVLSERLQRLLGKRYATLLANMRTVGPLTAEGNRWFITGNRPHEGGQEAAAIVMDAGQDAVRVWLLHKGEAMEFQDPPQARVDWPRDVQTLQQNAADLGR